jgi:predicted transposase YdaD
MDTQKDRGHTQGERDIHPWDTRIWLFSLAPEDMVDWLLGSKAEFVGLANTEFERKEIVSDMLYTISVAGQKELLHVEFQKRRDTTMARRLCEDNMCDLFN